MIVLQFLLIVAVILGVSFWIGFLIENFRLGRRGDRAIYHASSIQAVEPVLQTIIAELLGNKTAEYTFVELGAGLGKVASWAARQYTWKTVEAIEVGWFIYQLGRARSVFRQLPIIWRREDILQCHLQKPAFVYCYLFPELLGRLHAAGVFKETVMLSLTFSLTGVSPTQKIAIPGWQKEIYVYDFRSARRKI